MAFGLLLVWFWHTALSTAPPALLSFSSSPCSFGFSSFSSVLPFDLIFGHKGGRQVGVWGGGVYEGRVWGSMGGVHLHLLFLFGLVFTYCVCLCTRFLHIAEGLSGHSSPRGIQRHSHRQCFGFGSECMLVDEPSG